MRAVSPAIIITSCTNRKMDTGEVVALARPLQAASVSALANHWKDKVAAAQFRVPAHALYQGRSFTEAKAAAAKAGAVLYIASAGHGIVESNEVLPGYNLTVTPGDSNLLVETLDRLHSTSADWWVTLTKCRPQKSLATLMSSIDLPEASVILALPSTYLSMILADLSTLNESQTAQLRIITSELGSTLLPKRLQKQVLPYDERLEALPAYAGTRNDFPQRALHHFVGELSGHTLSLRAAKQCVHEAMATLKKSSPPKREKKSDGELLQLIRCHRLELNNSQSAMLRWLRDDQKISCEQERFRHLWHQVQAENPLK